MLASATADFSKKLSCLSVPCEFELVVSEGQLPAPQFTQPNDPIVPLKEHLEWLDKAARAAYKRNVTQRGPMSDTVTYLAVEALVLLYESGTGRAATHSSSRPRSGYTGRPLSDCGRFVAAAVAIIDPALKQRGVTDALEHVIWASRGKATPLPDAPPHSSHCRKLLAP
jgi:hypothetical protein